MSDAAMLAMMIWARRLADDAEALEAASAAHAVDLLEKPRLVRVVDDASPFVPISVDPLA